MESLKCNICGKPAAVHIEQIVHSIKQTINLCEACARSYGVLTSNVMPFSVTKNIGTALFGDLNPTLAAQDCCEYCGYTMELFKKTGNLGCPQCYESLREKLLPLIENMQKNLDHIGKQPKCFTVHAKKTLTQESLEEKLRLAIEGERFEEAARIRDALRSLKLDENG
ncbi:MAG: UvrB/UvrC motif-containing protein [Puniceicoccales bacterium]|jgi:protein arginine kinase activator|nr:UvrB/UvrC motif-containing protein [Puniceicoccales bacterium]